MNIKISGKTRKYIILYLGLLVLLYLVIVLVPKITDAFESTQTLEPGELRLSCETTGYLIKTEAIGTAGNAGAVEYKYDPGKIVGKDWKVVTIDAGDAIQEAGDTVSSAFANQMNQLKNFDRVKETNNAIISGIFSLTFDGNEDFFSPENMYNITREEADSRSTSRKKLKRTSTKAGDPLFKITNDGRWYFICWLKEKERNKFDEGQEVTLTLPEGNAQGRIEKIDKEGKRFRTIITSNRYYKKLEETRKVDATVTGTNAKGLVVDNDCLIDKDGVQGVYVRDKNGEYSFTPVQIINTDGEQSVVTESRYYDQNGKMIMTVSVYDEISKNPKRELKRDLKREEEKKKEKEQEQEQEQEEN